ncbi:MAG: SlyX family protein [Spirochaetales bacterium]|nr:SlyX family protein [Spirochaetales bacterium]MBQ5365360.1 SlyX family protein [Spirochaetales bacterium]MBQ6671645.1 SlyX family protein [Spirochaetales bacterium]MBQ7508388.1 SlyX family protein [Spirochaetales bacterium]
MQQVQDRLEKIETDMVYLQDQVRELNDIVTKQQLLVTRLEKQNEALAKRLEELDTEARPNRRPPHY